MKVQNLDRWCFKITPEKFYCFSWNAEKRCRWLNVREILQLRVFQRKVSGQLPGELQARPVLLQGLERRRWEGRRRGRREKKESSSSLDRAPEQPGRAGVSLPPPLPIPLWWGEEKTDVRERKRKSRTEEGKKKRKRRLIELCGDRVWMSQWRAAIVLPRPQFGTVRSSFYCTVSCHNASFLLHSAPSLSLKEIGGLRPAEPDCVSRLSTIVTLCRGDREGMFLEAT